MHVSRLRRALTDAGVGAERVRIARLLDHARARPEPDERAEVLREVLALWQGAPLDGLGERFGIRECASLEERRLIAWEMLAETELAVGRQEQLPPELVALSAAHPIRERLMAAHMLALYRCGRPLVSYMRGEHRSSAGHFTAALVIAEQTGTGSARRPPTPVAPWSSTGAGTASCPRGATGGHWRSPGPSAIAPTRRKPWRGWATFTRSGAS